jgi:hypothetical protein
MNEYDESTRIFRGLLIGLALVAPVWALATLLAVWLS